MNKVHSPKAIEFCPKINLNTVTPPIVDSVIFVAKSLNKDTPNVPDQSINAKIVNNEVITPIIVKFI